MKSHLLFIISMLFFHCKPKEHINTLIFRNKDHNVQIEYADKSIVLQNLIRSFDIDEFNHLLENNLLYEIKYKELHAAEFDDSGWVNEELIYPIPLQNVQFLKKYKNHIFTTTYHTIEGTEDVEPHLWAFNLDTYIGTFHPIKKHNEYVPLENQYRRIIGMEIYEHYLYLIQKIEDYSGRGETTINIISYDLKKSFDNPKILLSIPLFHKERKEEKNEPKPKFLNAFQDHQYRLSQPPSYHWDVREQDVTLNEKYLVLNINTYFHFYVGMSVGYLSTSTTDLIVLDRQKLKPLYYLQAKNELKDFKTKLLDNNLYFTTREDTIYKVDLSKIKITTLENQESSVLEEKLSFRSLQKPLNPPYPPIGEKILVTDFDLEKQKISQNAYNRNYFLLEKEDKIYMKNFIEEYKTQLTSLNFSK